MKVVKWNPWNWTEKKCSNFRKWVWIGSARLVVGPKKLPTPRVLRFSEDLHCQKLLLTNILGGDTLQLFTGACSPEHQVRIISTQGTVTFWWCQTFISISWTVFVLRNMFPKSYWSIIIGKTNVRKPIGASRNFERTRNLGSGLRVV